MSNCFILFSPGLRCHSFNEFFFWSSYLNVLPIYSWSPLFYLTFSFSWPLSQAHILCDLLLLIAYLLGEDNGTPLQYSYLENPMDGGTLWAAVHGVAKSRTRLSDFTFTFRFQALEKEMATHSSVLAWRIPGTEESGGLPSMGSESQTRLKQLSSSSSIAYLLADQLNYKH